MREVQENTRKNEKAYHETLVLLKWARAENPAAVSQVDRALIQSLEEQLNNANQQRRELCEERALNAADGQMAVQQSQTNEQLEALCAEGNKLRKAIQKVAAEREGARQVNLKLRMQSLGDKAKSATEFGVLRARCMKAEAGVTKLQGKTRS